MKNENRFKTVWSALEDDPVRVENLKLRSALIIEITEKIKDQELTQSQAAELLRITQPRVSALLQGKINEFRLGNGQAIVIRPGEIAQEPDAAQIVH
ncbi:MAG: helix-turn-helix domain-containing protein [bacterium]